MTLKDGAVAVQASRLHFRVQAGRLRHKSSRSDGKRRQWQAVVRGVSDEQLAMLRGHETIDSVEVHSASLEDIFVAYMQEQNSRELTAPGT